MKETKTKLDKTTRRRKKEIKPERERERHWGTSLSREKRSIGIVPDDDIARKIYDHEKQQYEEMTIDIYSSSFVPTSITNDCSYRKNGRVVNKHFPPMVSDTKLSA